MATACSTFGCPGLAIPGRSKCQLHTPRRAADNRKRPGRYNGTYKANRARLLSTNPMCCYPGCNKPANTADHIIPVDAGGTHDMDNLRPMCLGHNGTLGNHYRWNK